MTLKARGTNFMSCYNQWDLKPGILNVSGLCSGRAEVDCGKLSHCPQRASRTNNPQKYTQKLQFEKCLGHTGGGLTYSSQSLSQRYRVYREIPPCKGADHYIICLQQALPTPLPSQPVDLPFPVILASVPALPVPSFRKLMQTLPTSCLPTCTF